MGVKIKQQLSALNLTQQTTTQEKKMEEQAKDIWKAPVEVEQERSREEDFSEYLEDLFMWLWSRSKAKDQDQEGHLGQEDQLKQED